MKKLPLFLLFAGLFIIQVFGQQPVYKDVPFWQDWSEYVYLKDTIHTHLQTVFSDRNQSIQVLSSKGLMKPYKDHLVEDRLYRPLTDMNIRDLIRYQHQFVYLTDQAILSNAWAGKLYIPHPLQTAHTFSGGNNFDFLIGSDTKWVYLNNQGIQWQHNLDTKTPLLDIIFDAYSAGFWILSENTLWFFDSNSQQLTLAHQGEKFTCMAALEKQILIGTQEGYFQWDKQTQAIEAHHNQLPWNELTCITEIDGDIWMGSNWGAFRQKPDGGFDYYASRRWLPDDQVVDIAKGPGNSVLILTNKGLAQIHFKQMTLEEKAQHYEKQVRQRHIRLGFNSESLRLAEPGNLSTGSYQDSDNDGLWTSMYLGSQLFRYAVTRSEEALQNAIESFEAMERLHAINGIPGFPSRSYERKGYPLHDSDAWHNLDEQWDWKGTTSSDEAIGHYFAFCLMAEIVEDEGIRNRAIKLIEEMTDHILEHDLYFVDIDGKPTRWARWNPDYVNGFPTAVGDRKLNSSNITGFLQAAYHFTGKEKYKTKAYELFEKYGYLKNLMRPMAEIGVVGDQDDLSKMLSSSWNHSDDEMYFLSYWYLYPYAFTSDLKQQYQEAIRDHWEIERPEKDGLWNFCYAMTGVQEFDLEESIWFLQEYPLDMIDWTIHNSHRKDIELLPSNFRTQTTRQVLPPDEAPIHKHNTNTFILDRDRGGNRELSGDLFLLPYWMGRYLGIISAPEKE